MKTCQKIEVNKLNKNNKYMNNRLTELKKKKTVLVIREHINSINIKLYTYTYASYVLLPSTFHFNI